MLWASRPLQAVAPANDLCAGSVIVPASGPFPWMSQVISNMSDATTAGDPALPSCQSSVSRSVWFKFVPSATAGYTFSLGADTATTLPDTVLALYTASGGGGCNSTLTEWACDDDVPGELRSALSATLTASTTYYILAWCYGTNAPGTNNNNLQLRVSKPVAPVNDKCSGSEVIPGAGPFPYFTTSTDIMKADTTSDPGVPSCQSLLSRSVWYKFVPNLAATYTFSTCLETATTVEDTVLAVYLSTNGCTGPFTEMACNDEACDPNRAMVSAPLNAGATYFVVCWEYGVDAPIPGKTLVQLKVSGPPPVFTTWQWQANGVLRLQFSGMPGSGYQVQASTNMQVWTTLGTASDSGGGHFVFNTTNSLAPSYKFFRVTMQ